jgi:hypothetical protein
MRLERLAEKDRLAGKDEEFDRLLGSVALRQFWRSHCLKIQFLKVEAGDADH